VWLLTGLVPQGTPAIGVANVYVVGDDGMLYAVGPEGTVAWVFDLRFRLDFSRSDLIEQGSNPAIGPDGTVYVALGNRLHAIDPSGSERWLFSACSFLSDPTLSPDSSAIYVQSLGGDLMAIAATDGRLQMNVAVGDPPYRRVAPAVGLDGTIYTVGRRLQALTARGELLWAYPPNITSEAEGCYDAPVVGDDARLYVPCGRGLSALNLAGEEIWTVALSDAYRPRAPTFGANRLIFQTNGPELLGVKSFGFIHRSWTASLSTGSKAIFSSTGAVAADGTIYLEGALGPTSSLWTLTR
jgi:outer membrane protein assembly factor BamB